MPVTAWLPNIPRSTHGCIQGLIVSVLLEAGHASFAVKLIIRTHTLHLKTVVEAVLSLSDGRVFPVRLLSRRSVLCWEIALQQPCFLLGVHADVARYLEGSVLEVEL